MVSSVVTLAVLLFSMGADEEERKRETPVSIFHPTLLVLSAGVSNAFLAGDLFNLFVGFEMLLFASYVLLTLGGTGERVRAGSTYVVVSLLSSTLFLIAIAAVYAATGTVNLAQLALRLPELPDGIQLVLQLLLLTVFCDQGGRLPAVGLAARLLPDRPRPGDRGVRRPAHQGRRLRDHPHPDRCCSPTAPSPRCCCGRRWPRWWSASWARSRSPRSSGCCRSPWSATSAT